MKCFNHRNSDSIAICKACGKALCSECIADLGHSISCKGSCEEKAELLQSILNRSAATVTAQKNNRYFLPMFFVFFGAVLLFTGLSDKNTFSLVTGVGFIAFGIFYIFSTRKWVKEIKNA